MSELLEIIPDQDKLVRFKHLRATLISIIHFEWNGNNGYLFKWRIHDKKNIKNPFRFHHSCSQDMFQAKNDILETLKQSL